MKKLLTLILILFVTPCFSSPICLIRAKDGFDIGDKVERCKKGDVLLVQPAPNSLLQIKDLHRNAALLCNYGKAIVITDNPPYLSCVFEITGTRGMRR